MAQRESTFPRANLDDVFARIYLVTLCAEFGMCSMLCKVLRRCTDRTTTALQSRQRCNWKVHRRVLQACLPTSDGQKPTRQLRGHHQPHQGCLATLGNRTNYNLFT
jgi:hypothetical protein